MNILQMSITASILIITIIILRALIIHKLPKKTFVVLWGIVLVRLLIPFSVPLPFNTYTVIDRTAEIFIGITETPILPIVESVMSSTSTEPTKNITIPFMLIAWSIGIVVCSLFFLIAHLRCRKEYGASLPIENDYIKKILKGYNLKRIIQIRQSDKINAPMTYGILKPVILFPKTTDWQNETQIRYVLTHELTHIKRFDILSKWLYAAALCIHWFNPLVWVMYILANRDIELFCDEKVVRSFGEKTKSVYAAMLIGLEETKNSFSPLCSNFAKNAIEERIIAIMKIKKKSILHAITAVGMITCVVVSLFILSASNLPKNPDWLNSSIEEIRETNSNAAAIIEWVEATLIEPMRNYAPDWELEHMVKLYSMELYKLKYNGGKSYISTNADNYQLNSFIEEYNLAIREVANSSIHRDIPDEYRDMLDNASVTTHQIEMDYEIAKAWFEWSLPFEISRRVERGFVGEYAWQTPNPVLNGSQ